MKKINTTQPLFLHLPARLADSFECLIEKADKPVAILQNLSGPKIRLGHIPKPGGRLDPRSHIILTTQIVEGSVQRISVSYPLLGEEVKAGDRILLADGFLELCVQSVNGSEIHCEVITGGVLTSQKGINLPSGTIRMPSMTEKDRYGLEALLVLVYLKSFQMVRYFGYYFNKGRGMRQKNGEVVHSNWKNGYGEKNDYYEYQSLFKE